MAIDFASKFLFTIAPDSRMGDKAKNQIWRITFATVKEVKTWSIGVVFIATYRSVNYKDNNVASSKLCFTVKQAGLLAMDTFNRVAAIALQG